MGLFEVLKGGVAAAIDTAPEMAGDRSNGSSTKSTKHSSSKGGSKKIWLGALVQSTVPAAVKTHGHQ